MKTKLWENEAAIENHLRINSIGLDEDFINVTLSRISGMWHALSIIASEDWDNVHIIDTYGDTFQEGCNSVFEEFQKYADNQEIILKFQ